MKVAVFSTKPYDERFLAAADLTGFATGTGPRYAVPAPVPPRPAPIRAGEGP